MKYNLWALSSALLLVGCAADDATGDLSGGGKASIVLGVKDVVSPVTRTQQTGSMDFTQLKTTGFGVYGYEGADAYNSESTEYNLFQANTHVTFISGGTEPSSVVAHPGNWTYDGELKEWDSTKKYTFFAYAPYMSAGEGTFGTDAGINTISTGAGDPTIAYTVAVDPAKSVDLLWGVRTDTSDKSGKPWIDIQQGKTASAVLFTFYHALCGLGLHAQVMVDQANDTLDLGDLSQMGTIGDANGCKVTLKSITITPKGFPNAEPVVAATLFHKSAKLNLNNTNTTAHQPLWQDHSGTISSLVLDGGEIDEALLDPHTDHVDDVTGYEVMTSESYDTEVPGITESANSQAIIADDNMFMLIPQDAQDYEVAIDYFITYKTGDSTYHREAKSGTATIRNLKLAAGVKYYLNLVFGLTTFKVNVLATDWKGETINTTVVIENGTSADKSLAKQSAVIME